MQCGLLVHVTAAAVGVAAVLLASAAAFTALKLVGAAYLVLLGVRAVRDSFRHRGTADVVSEADVEQVALRRVWWQSFTGTY